MSSCPRKFPLSAVLLFADISKSASSIPELFDFATNVKKLYSFSLSILFFKIAWSDKGLILTNDNSVCLYRPRPIAYRYVTL